jgi:hypothetical protein
MLLWMASGVVRPVWLGATAATQTGGAGLHVHRLVRICRFTWSEFCKGGVAVGSATTWVDALNLFTTSSV